MAWLASLPGRLLERVGNGAPRGMAVTPPQGGAQNPAYRATSRPNFCQHCPGRHPEFPGGDFALSGSDFFVDNFVDILKDAL